MKLQLLLLSGQYDSLDKQALVVCRCTNFETKTVDYLARDACA
jgi:hypothetical protein